MMGIKTETDRTMNWLAHILLSRNCIDYRLGNLLADPLKGRSWEGAPRAFDEGLAMHCRIDAFTDADPVAALSRARLGGKKYLKGVIIDLTYDHLLSTAWPRYCPVPLETFLAEFHRDARIAAEAYPPEARDFVRRITASGVLGSYGTLEGLGCAFERIDSRLSPRLRSRESAREYLPIVRRELPKLQEDFDAFFPRLIAHTGWPG